ncbi:MAG: hypothetical protein GF388_11295 [Candidatus Aegiribacteria sp.]|nr:hypothetical protein [Candidatus Aegiribacteria sp.]
MRGTLIIGLLGALLLTVFATPWPVGVTPAGQDSSWTIMTSYGTFHFDWEDVSNPVSFANFHFGIDIPDYPGFAGEDTVRCVRDGYVTNMDSVAIRGRTSYQYHMVICDSMSDTTGWFYGHMDDPNFSENDAVYLSDSIGVMTHLISTPHVHFMRSDSVYNHQNPGLLNPLDSLIPPASSASGFVWEFAESADTLFFLEEMDHLAWPQYNQGHPEDVWQYQVEPGNIHDAVDLFYGYRLLGNGINPISLGEFPLNPHMIKWTANRYLVSDTSEVLTRYVAEFTGQIGASADSTKYRQFYFRWSRLNYLIPSLGNGLISCLTNCGDTAGWNGINNIEENCWQTDIDNELSGVTANPVLAAYPDGPYRVDVFAYAYDTTVVDTTSIDVELHNFDPVVEKVILSSEGNTVWEAYWTAEGLTPVLNNPADAGVLPGQQLDVTVVFSAIASTNMA